MTKLLSIQGLTVTIPNQGDDKIVLDEVSLDIDRGEMLGLVGPSGSGKSMLTLTLLGLLSEIGATITNGAIAYYGSETDVRLDSLSEAEYKNIRGAEIGVVFQDPISSLNPAQRCGKQLLESLSFRNSKGTEDGKNNVLRLLTKLQLANPDRIYTSFPHEISGGQAQRVMIAMALLQRPKLLLADEPTSSLDSVTQMQIVQILRSLCQEMDLAILFISHNAEMIEAVCDRVIRVNDGKITGTHVSRTSLVESNVTGPGVEAGNPILTLDNVYKSFRHKKQILSLSSNLISAVEGVSITISEGQIVGLIGSSGCGKSTIANMILRLLTPNSGEIVFQDHNIFEFTKQEEKQYTKDVQIIFQNPLSSLNPRWTIRQILHEPLDIHKLYPDPKVTEQVCREMIHSLQLPQDTLDRFPHQFSGGQCQRIAIARALLIQPRLLICDECIAALDADNQGIILNILSHHVMNNNLAILFITHNLNLIYQFANEIHVMDKGRIIGSGSVNDIMSSPKEVVKDLLMSSKWGKNL